MWGLCLALGGGLGCGHGASVGALRYEESLAPGRVAPQDPDDAALLAKVAASARARTEPVGAWLATLGERYDAASGRQCCPVALRKPSEPAATRERLACDIDGRWAFVPTVVAGGSEWPATP